MSSVLELENCPKCGAKRKDSEEESNFCLKCGFPLFLIAGKYRLLATLGQGGFGTVYRARHVHLDEDADRVIKVARTELFSSENMQKRFRREVQVTASLSQRNHHIVRVYDDFGKVQGLGYFYVMEFLEGKDLRGFFTNSNKLPPVEWCVDIVMQLCSGIQEAHEAGIVHRDLKPENIVIISRKKQPYFVKIIDFGIAKPLLTKNSLTQGVLGSPHYMSPEQCDGDVVDHRSDIYAIGIILYELLTGVPPFYSGDNQSNLSVMMAHLSREPSPLRKRAPERSIPESLEGIVLKALMKSPDDRFQSADDLLSALEQIKATLPPPSLLEASNTNNTLLIEDSPSDEVARMVEEAETANFDSSLNSMLPSFNAETSSIHELANEQSGRHSTAPFEDGKSITIEGSGHVDAFSDTMMLDKIQGGSSERIPMSGVPGPLPTGFADVSVEVIEELDVIDEPFDAPKTSNSWGMVIGVFLVLLLSLGGYRVWMGIQKPTENLSNKKVFVATPQKRAVTQKRGNPVKRSVPKPVIRRALLAKTPPRPVKRAEPRRPVVQRRAIKRRVVKRVAKRRVYRRRIPRRRWKRRVIRPRPVVRRVVKKKGICGAETATSRWVYGRLIRPKRGRISLRFFDCSGCKKRRAKGGLCLSIPVKLKRVRVRIAVEGYSACRHTIRQNQSKIGWRLDEEEMDALANENYNCVR